MIKWKKYICIALSATMMAATLAGCGDTSSDASSDKAEATTETSDADTLEQALTSQISAEQSDDADKEETVYVVSDASGDNEQVTVSAWLKNTDGSEGLNDYTKLTDIENVKGYEAYQTNDDGTITWQANGNDIYYQGKSTEELPVDVKISYKLDGKEIEPEELAGKSGKVTIRFEYKNNTKQTVKAGDKNVEVVSPFVMLSGMILPVDKFSNVQVTNGKVLSEGSNQVVVGYAVPGFKDCLEKGIDDSKIQEVIGDINVPDYVEVTADVTDFELAMTMTIAASDLLDSDAENVIDEAKEKADIDSLTDDVDTLSSSADQLAEGSGTLKTGLDTLKEGTYSLKTGASSLAQGAESLETYTSQLATGTSQISTAIGSLDEGIASIKSGSLALKDGAATLATGAKTVDDGVQNILDGESTLDTGVATIIAGYAGDGTEANPGVVSAAKSLASGTKTMYKSSKTLATGAGSLATGAKSVSDGITELITTFTSMPATVASSAKTEVLSGVSAYGIADEAGIQAAIGNLEAVLSAGPEAVGGADVYQQYLAQYKALAQAEGALKAIDSIETSLSAALTSDEVTASTSTLQAGAAEVVTGATTVSDGAAALRDALKTTSDGASSLSGGINSLYKGTKTISTGVDSLITGTKTLKTGTKSLKDGAATISTNMNTLYKGSVTLASGSSKLVTAATTLNTSAGQIATGAKELSDGADELNSGSQTLDNGAEQLVSGAATLSDGMSQFNEDGIKKITKLFAGNYQDDIDYIEALFSDDAKYTTYGGAIDGTSSTVKFIYETGAIKADNN